MRLRTSGGSRAVALRSVLRYETAARWRASTHCGTKLRRGGPQGRAAARSCGAVARRSANERVWRQGSALRHGSCCGSKACCIASSRHRVLPRPPRASGTGFRARRCFDARALATFATRRGDYVLRSLREARGAACLRRSVLAERLARGAARLRSSWLAEQLSFKAGGLRSCVLAEQRSREAASSRSSWYAEQRACGAAGSRSSWLAEQVARGAVGSRSA